MNRDDVLRLVRGPSRPTLRQLQHRRRRARALFGVGLLALLLGLIVGANHGGPQQAKAASGRVGWYGHLKMLAGGGRGSLDLEQRAVENGAVDRALGATPFVRLGGRETREIALTFDDGPGEYTERVLATLRRYSVPATFFEVGREVPGFPQSVQALTDAGMTIGDHSQDHPDFTTLSQRDQTAEIDDAARAIQGTGAAAPRLFRPPYGAFNQTTRQLLAQRRMLAVLWSVDSEDYTRPGVDQIVHNVVPAVFPGAIILMHDGGGDRSETVGALEQIIPELKRQGYRFVSIPRLMLDNPPVAGDQGVQSGYDAAG
ncbi:MAG TPA: polysaccharide deacetylase family protein [Conexibacter sp.]|jgi:peptidoglycan/xylan/chitin deacetylase (PgdA/CDA1 family)